MKATLKFRLTEEQKIGTLPKSLLTRNIWIISLTTYVGQSLDTL